MLLNPTPRDPLADTQGRPDFIWDNPLTVAEFEALLADPDPEVRVYAFGVLRRQAKPDDVFISRSPRCGHTSSATSVTSGVPDVAHRGVGAARACRPVGS
jgi:hypothetical protein